MTTSTYKGKDIFVGTAGSEYVSMGGRDSEMTFGIGTIVYTELYDAARTIAVGPNAGADFNLKHLASDAAADLQLTALVDGETYIVADLNGSSGISDPTDGDVDASLQAIAGAGTNNSDLADDTVFAVGTEFTVSADVAIAANTVLFTQPTNTLTQDIEAVQAKINTARVQAGSQYAALESAVNYTTDLTAQYELGYNTVNDVNFSMETAHLAKNQILQQAATAMLAQANLGQQGLLQLIN